jgi:maltose O-acetyltransferase
MFAIKIFTRLRHISTSPFFPYRLRVSFLRFTGCVIGEFCGIEPQVHFDDLDISIGNHVYINRGGFFGRGGKITIGDYVRIGPYVRVLSGTHGIAASTIRRDPTDNIAKHTIIGRGCWIGVGVTILGGVKVGDGCVLAAGAVVTANTSPNSVYAGVPARKIRDLPVDAEEEDRIVNLYG